MEVLVSEQLFLALVVVGGSFVCVKLLLSLVALCVQVLVGYSISSKIPHASLFTFRDVFKNHVPPLVGSKHLLCLGTKQ